VIAIANAAILAAAVIGLTDTTKGWRSAERSPKRIPAKLR
jgi:hypothetical protein